MESFFATFLNLMRMVEAIARSTWMRLKACPDCQWVFYDHTKNKNKVWCLMTASGPQGRSCGSISKVRSFRQRQKARAPEETRMAQSSRLNQGENDFIDSPHIFSLPDGRRERKQNDV